MRYSSATESRALAVSEGRSGSHRSGAAPSRRLFASLAAAAILAVGLGACSTTDGGGSGTSGDGSSTGRGAGAGVTGGALTGNQLREALAREGVSDRVLFGYDSADLSAEARATVEKWARVLNQHGATKVVIEGHCDERGTREYNLALGERRAVSVRNFLTGLGVNSARLQTISFGKEKPVVVGSNDESWAQNRRGVLAVD